MPDRVRACGQARREHQTVRTYAIARAMLFHQTSCGLGNLWGKFFSVRQVVTIPPNQGSGADVFKQKFQRRRFDVAVAKDHARFAMVSGVGGPFTKKAGERIMTPKDVLTRKDFSRIAMKPIADGHHCTWVDDV